MSYVETCPTVRLQQEQNSYRLPEFHSISTALVSVPNHLSKLNIQKHQQTYAQTPLNLFIKHAFQALHLGRRAY